MTLNINYSKQGSFYHAVNAPNGVALPYNAKALSKVVHAPFKVLVNGSVAIVHPKFI